MTSLTVTAATRAQQDPVIGVITLAFSTDPVARFALPDPATYLAQMGPVVQAFGGAALDHGSAWYVEGFLGAALWLPPAVHPDHETLDALIERHVPEPRQRTMSEAFEQMGASHPDEPHWYLPLIGIDPSRQNQGLGSLLMQHAHSIFDRDGTLAYLESSNPKNIPFYQRHGYEVLRTIRVGSCPPISPMLRKPRPKSAR
jgi:ribosomal protein S18 acetylase RimI-like enzyme